MSTRREFLTSLLSAGAMGLIVACGGGAGGQAPANPTTAPAQPAAPGAPAPTQAAPAQTANKQPAAAGGSIGQSPKSCTLIIRFR